MLDDDMFAPSADAAAAVARHPRALRTAAQMADAQAKELFWWWFAAILIVPVAMLGLSQPDPIPAAPAPPAPIARAATLNRSYVLPPLVEHAETAAEELAPITDEAR